MITRLIYCSKIPETFSADVKQIIDISVKNNERANVTGMLYFGNRNLFQCLEGPKVEVDRIYEKIITDPRHMSCTLLSYRVDSERLFTNWNMAYLDPQDSKIQSIISQYSGNQGFQPSEMDSNTSEKLLLSFRDALKEIKRTTF